MTVYPYVDSKIPSAEHFMSSGNLRTIFFFLILRNVFCSLSSLVLKLRTFKPLSNPKLLSSALHFFCPFAISLGAFLARSNLLIYYKASVHFASQFIY